MARKPKDRSATCDSCGAHVPNPCAVRTTVMLCQKDAKALMIEGAYLSVRVVVHAPASEASDAEAISSTNARAALSTAGTTPEKVE